MTAFDQAHAEELKTLEKYYVAKSHYRDRLNHRVTISYRQKFTRAEYFARILCKGTRQIRKITHQISEALRS